MATYYKCAFCEKYTKSPRARQCSYCGKYLCRTHRINGLCPIHVKMISKDKADRLRRLDNALHWFIRIMWPILVINFGLMLIVFNPDNRIIGFIFIGVFALNVPLFILITRSLKNKMGAIRFSIDFPEGMQKQVNFCRYCKKVLPARVEQCPQCFNPVLTINTEAIMQTDLSDGRPTTTTLRDYSQSSYSTQSQSTTARYSQFSEPLSSPSTPPKEEKSLPPPPPPGFQSRFPPPKKEKIQSQSNYSSSNTSDELLSDIIQNETLTNQNTKDGITCKICGNQVKSTGGTGRCPYCNNLLQNA